MYGTKSYSLNKFIKKIAFWTIVSVVLVFIIGFFIITTLNSNLQELSTKSEILEIESKILIQKNIQYTSQIKSKVQSIKELGDQLEEIEEIIGINKDDTTTLIQRATLAKLTSAQKVFMLQTIPNGCPLAKCRTTSKFGWRIHPITHKKKFHKGIDLKAKRRTDIIATADGVVSYTKSKNFGASGRVVKILHNYGFETVYAHLKSINVKIGDVIKKGQVIAKSGNSGRSNGPHLHYELKYANKVLNPYDFIKWDMKNYENIFNKQRRVEWESLVDLIRKQNKIVVQQ